MGEFGRNLLRGWFSSRPSFWSGVGWGGGTEVGPTVGTGRGLILAYQTVRNSFVRVAF